MKSMKSEKICNCKTKTKNNDEEKVEHVCKCGDQCSCSENTDE